MEKVESLFNLALNRVAQNYVDEPEKQIFISQIPFRNKIIQRAINLMPYKIFDKDYKYEEKLKIQTFFWKHLFPLTKTIEKDVYLFGFMGREDVITLKNGYKIRQGNSYARFITDIWMTIYPEMEIKPYYFYEL